jgi:hypothetical protein
MKRSSVGDPSTDPQNTEQLIDSLVGDLGNASESINFRRTYWLSWGGAVIWCALLTAFLCWQWPLLARLPTGVWSFRFDSLSILWFAAFIALARITFLSSIPLANSRNAKIVFFSLFGALAFLVLSHESLSSLVSEIPGELDLGRGPCGFLILLTGVFTGGFLLSSLRRGVAAEPSHSGAWALATAGCLSSFFMQLICRHENPAHVLLWHVLPIFILAFAGSKLATWVLVK